MVLDVLVFVYLFNVLSTMVVIVIVIMVVVMVVVVVMVMVVVVVVVMITSLEMGLLTLDLDALERRQSTRIDCDQRFIFTQADFEVSLFVRLFLPLAFRFLARLARLELGHL